MNRQWYCSWENATRYKVIDCEMGQSKFRLNVMLHTDVTGDEGRQNSQLNQKNRLNVILSNLARIGSVQICHLSAYSRMCLTSSTGFAYSCSIQPDVPYTVHWLCLQLQHTAGCTLHRPLAVPTAAHCSVSISSLCFKVFILRAPFNAQVKWEMSSSASVKLRISGFYFHAQRYETRTPIFRCRTLRIARKLAVQ
jgi:hypothetical protein